MNKKSIKGEASRPNMEIKHHNGEARINRHEARKQTYIMRSSMLTFLMLCVLFINTSGQNKNDTTKSNKYFYNFGASTSLTAARFVNTSLADYAQNLLSLSYTTQYYKVNPQFTFFFIIGKHRFLNKTEFSLSHIRTRYAYTYQYYHWNPNGYWEGKSDIVNTFHFFDLKDKIGFKLKRLCFWGGLYVGYLISGTYYHEDVYGVNDTYWKIHIKNHLRYGVECEINYYISKHLYLGVGSSISNKINSLESASFINKYRIFSFQFTVGAKFLKDRNFHNRSDR